MAGGNTELAAIDNVNTELNVMTQNLYGIENLCEIVGYAFKAAFNTVWIKELEIETNICVQNIQNIEYNLNDVNKSLEETGEKTNELSKSNDKISGMFKAAVDYVSKIDVSKILNASDELVQSTAKLNMMNDDLLTTDQLTQKIYTSAQNARGSFEGMTDFVTQMGMNSGDSFGSVEEIITFGNLLQKQMTIAGASTEEASEMMSQLAESSEKGVLGGDELSTIFEKMPNMVQSVAAYLEQPVEKVQKWASEGKITTNTLKNAMFASAEEINEKFGEMPMTWEQIGQAMKDTAMNKFQPVLQMVNDVANSAPFQALINGVTIALGITASVVGTIFGLLGSLAGNAYDHWSMLMPVIYGVIAALGIYTLALGAYSVARTISNVQDKIAEVQNYKNAKAAIADSLAQGLDASAKDINTVAQASLNTVLSASPITWITLLVIGLVVAIIMLCNWIAQTCGVAQTGFGVLAGGISVVIAFITNIIVGLANFINGIFASICNLIATFSNFFANVFQNPIAAIQGLFIGLFVFISNIIESIVAVIDTIFRTDWSSGLANVRKEIVSGAEGLIGEQKIKMETVEPDTFMHKGFDYGEEFAKGAAWGDEKAGQFSDWLSSFGVEEDALIPFEADGSGKDIADIADDTSNISNSMDISNENLKYLRDIAERDAVNRFTTAQIKVAMTNNNNINNSMDLDGIINHLVNGVNEAMVQSAEGVNAYA